MRQFCSCQVCHNQWIPAYSHRSPVQPLGDVCCAGAKETAHRPVVFLSPLLHLAGQKICVCLRTFAPSSITHAHAPLEPAGIMVKGGHQRLFCISVMLVQGQELLVKSHTSVSCIFSTSTGSTLPSACRFPCSKENVVLSPWFGVPAWPHPGEMASKLWGTSPCSLALLADDTYPATAARAIR